MYDIKIQSVAKTRLDKYDVELLGNMQQTDKVELRQMVQ